MPALVTSKRRVASISGRSRSGSGSTGQTTPLSPALWRLRRQRFGRSTVRPRRCALFERALAIQERRLGAQHRAVAISLKEVAGTLRQLHRDAEASQDIERALRIWTAAGAPDDPEYAEALALAADIRAERGNVAEAVRTYDRAVAIYERGVRKCPPGSGAGAHGVGADDGADARKKRALELADGAEEVGREHLRLMLRSLPERQALNYASVRPRGVDLMLSLVGVTPGAEREAIDAVIRSRALVLDEVAARRRGLTARTASGRRRCPCRRADERAKAAGKSRREGPRVDAARAVRPTRRGGAPGK